MTEGEVVSRVAAAVFGRVRYFTGKPCLAGHVVERYTRNGTCVECQRQMTARNRADVRELMRKAGAP